MQSVRPSIQWTQARLVVGAAIALAILIGFAIWSGVPRGERATSFWLGVTILVAVLFAFGWAAWQLLIRPLPAGQPVPGVQPIRANIRQALALLLGVGGMSVIVGAFWDEVWHRRYGIPFGDDFFWRPHLLMYFGFGSVTLLAFAGLYFLMRQGKGTLPQRFRANPVVVMLILVGGFLMFVLPADPVWHAIYGQDIAAWSIPHLLLVVSFLSINLLSVAIYLSTQPPREWRKPFRLDGGDLLPLFNFAACFLAAYQFFTTEWDSRSVNRLISQRPEWLLPVLIVGVAVWIGLIANHSLRVPGAATLSGVLALAIRYALIRLFDVPQMMLTGAWITALLPLVALDLYMAFTVLSGRRPSWSIGSAAGAVGMAVSLLTLYRQHYGDYPVTNLPVALVAVLLASLGAGWAGAAIGDYFAGRNKQVEDSAVPSRAPLASAAILAACALFVVFFVTTAAPPM